MRAIGHSDIKEMQKQEAEKGFKEKPANASLFFIIAGSWKTELPENLAKKNLCRSPRDDDSFRVFR